MISLLMKSGKHAGLVITVLDYPNVTEHRGNMIRVLLPGLEGDGVLVPDEPSAN